MTDCISHLLSRQAKVELLTLVGRRMLHDVITSTYVPSRRRCVTTGSNLEWKYLKALAEGHYGYFRYGNEPLKGVSEEAFRLARHNAELDTFVEDLFKGDKELYIPGVIPSSELIPTIIQAFKRHSRAHIIFRPLSLRLSHASLDLYEIWPAAADRRIRPCPFCVTVVELNNGRFPLPHVTDRYHIRNADSGQQLTIELSQCCIRLENDYGEPEEHWARLSDSVGFVRILVDDGVRCQPVLPGGPKRPLALLQQKDLLLEVFGFASRDDLDATQLTCKSWRDIVTEAAGTLALRPLQHVLIDPDHVAIQSAPACKAMPGAVFDARWELIPGYRPKEFHPEDVPIIMSLLRHGCALQYECYHEAMHLFCSISQHLADSGRTFRAKSAILRCFGQQEITTSLSLMAEIGVKDFDLRVFVEGAASLIFANEVLLNAERFHLRIGDYDGLVLTVPEVIEIQEHCHQYLRTAVGCHVSFLQFDTYALFSCDDLIERFLAAARSDDFTMPLSIQMQFDTTPPGIPKPANCKHPTLRDVAISRRILIRYHGGDALKFDVYHFHNYMTKEWLTVCLGKDLDGTIGYVFLQKGRMMASLEDIAKMKI